MKLEREIGKRRYRTRLTPHCGWPELTALVDILFIALLFFVLSSSFVRVSGISVELPRVKAPNIADLERFIISVAPSPSGAESRIPFRDQPDSADTLRQRPAESRQLSGNNPSVPGAGCQIYFRGKPVSLDTLRQRLAELRQRPGSNPSVVIRADRKVPFERMAEIMAIAESAGIGCFLAVMPPEDKTPQSFGQ